MEMRKLEHSLCGVDEYEHDTITFTNTFNGFLGYGSMPFVVGKSPNRGFRGMQPSKGRKGL